MRKRYSVHVAPSKDVIRTSISCCVVVIGIILFYLAMFLFGNEIEINGVTHALTDQNRVDVLLSVPGIYILVAILLLMIYVIIDQIGKYRGLYEGSRSLTYEFKLESVCYTGYKGHTKKSNSKRETYYDMKVVVSNVDIGVYELTFPISEQSSLATLTKTRDVHYLDNVTMNFTMYRTRFYVLDEVLSKTLENYFV